MNILLLGSGGREHAIAWKIAQSPKVEKLFIAPGNAGTAQTGTNVNIKTDDFPVIKDFVLANDIQMVVVGPEDPLVKGVYDYFKNDPQLAAIPVIGPSKAGAQLEGSKDFAKAFMMRHQIPTARYKSITAENLEEGFAFLESLPAPYVLKADGLAAGKGVLIIDSLEEAKKEQEAGAGLILWTCRAGKELDAAIAACKEWGLNFDTVNQSLPEWIEAWGSDSRKVGADEYWDDKAVIADTTCILRSATCYQRKNK